MSRGPWPGIFRPGLSEAGVQFYSGVLFPCGKGTDFINNTLYVVLQPGIEKLLIKPFNVNFADYSFYNS